MYILCYRVVCKLVQVISKALQIKEYNDKGIFMLQSEG